MLLQRSHIVLFLASLLVACTGDPRQPDPGTTADNRTVPSDTAFLPNSFSRGRVVQHLAGDLDGTGEEERILALVESIDGVPSFAVADRILVIVRDITTRRWSVVYTDRTRWTSGLALRDVTGDGLPDLLLQRHGGGNDPIATQGLAIVSADGGRLHPVLSLRHGAPRLVTDDDGVTRVEVRARLWPPLVPHAESTEFLDELLVFHDGLFRADRGKGRQRFVAMARGALREYDAVRLVCMGDTLRFTDSAQSRWNTMGESSPLFTPAARLLLSARRHGMRRLAERFWAKEKDFLRRRLAAEQFLALDSMSSRLVADIDEGTEAME